MFTALVRNISLPLSWKNHSLRNSLQIKPHFNLMIDPQAVKQGSSDGNVAICRLGSIWLRAIAWRGVGCLSGELLVPTIESADCTPFSCSVVCNNVGIYLVYVLEKCCLLFIEV